MVRYKYIKGVVLWTGANILHSHVFINATNLVQSSCYIDRDIGWMVEKKNERSRLSGGEGERMGEVTRGTVRRL
jgi:hypothetical protein